MELPAFVSVLCDNDNMDHEFPPIFLAGFNIIAKWSICLCRVSDTEPMFHTLHMGLVMPHRHNQGERLSQDFCRGEAKEICCTVIPYTNDTVFINGDFCWVDCWQGMRGLMHAAKEQGRGKGQYTRYQSNTQLEGLGNSQHCVIKKEHKTQKPHPDDEGQHTAPGRRPAREPPGGAQLMYRKDHAHYMKQQCENPQKPPGSIHNHNLILSLSAMTASTPARMMSASARSSVGVRG